MHGNLVQVCFCSWDSSMDIPAGDSFLRPIKKGFLHKLIGRGWLYSGSWRNRYCVLDGSKFYFYENESSKGSEKSCGVINLDYYDVCEENNVKDKKMPHVFVIGTSVRGFFDNRHQFSCETAEELQSWIETIRATITEARHSRRKPGRKQPQRPQGGGKSPDLSSSSQDSEGTSTSCLVNATKDRVKGPQGRRLPQRKSMMPTTHSPEESDIRQRSISLSSPIIEDDQEEDTSQPFQPTNETKWLSLSMEEMDREKDHAPSQRSSSAFDLPQEESTPLENGAHLKKKLGAHRLGGNVLGQHAAVARELELKLKAGMTPGPKRPQTTEDEAVDVQNTDAESGKKLECLTARVDLTKDTLNVLEERVSVLTGRVEATGERSEKAKSEVGDVLLQVTVTLKEAERINEECKRALAEANKARTEYQMLVKMCKETLAKPNGTPESQNGK